MSIIQFDKSLYNSYDKVIHFAIEYLYPQIFNQLHLLSDQLCEENIWDDDNLINSHIQLIDKAIDELYRKEKLILFPFVIQYAQRSSSNVANFPNFDWVFKIHSEIDKQINLFKKNLYRMFVDKQSNNEQKDKLTNIVNQLDAHFILLQLIVEEQILSQIEHSTII